MCLKHMTLIKWHIYSSLEAQGNKLP